MTEKDGENINCPACRKRYVWREALAGKAVRCQCGEVFNYPGDIGGDSGDSGVGADGDGSVASLNNHEAVGDSSQAQARTQTGPIHPDPFSIDFPAKQPKPPALPIPSDIEIASTQPPLAESNPASSSDPYSLNINLDADVPNSAAGNIGANADSIAGANTAAREPFPADGKCPGCNLPMKVSARLCINCGYNLNEGTKVKTAVVGDIDSDPAMGPGAGSVQGSPSGVGPAGPPLTRPPLREGPLEEPPEGSRYRNKRRAIQTALHAREDDAKHSPFVETWIPLIFIVTGLFVTLWEATVRSGETNILVIFPAALMLFAVRALITVPLIFGGALLTVRLLGSSYGPLLKGLYKFTAIACGPLAVGNLIMAYIMAATLGIGMMLAYTIYIVMFAVPLIWLFELDILETIIILVFVMLSKMILTMVGVLLLLS